MHAFETKISKMENGIYKKVLLYFIQNNSLRLFFFSPTPPKAPESLTLGEPHQTPSHSHQMH